MGRSVRVLAFSGSLRRQSFNQKLVRIAARGAEQAGAAVRTISLADYPLPVLNEDDEQATGLPANARKLKDLFLDADALLIASPEYNSSLSAALKNLIDWVSRPVPGEAPLGCFAGKTASLLAASPGALGGLRGLVHIRAILSSIKVTVLPDQLAVAKAHEAFDEHSNLRDTTLQQAAMRIGETLARTTAKLNA